MIVNIALLTVTDTRTFDNDKSGAILVEKIKEANHNLIDRKICKDNKDDIILILKDWINKKDIDVVITTGGTGKEFPHRSDYRGSPPAHTAPPEPSAGSGDWPEVG